MRSLLKKLHGMLKQYRAGIIPIILNRMIPEQFRYQTYILFGFDLRKQEVEGWQEREDLTLKKVSSPEDRWFERFRRKFPDPEFKQRIANRNRECWLAVKEGEIAGYAWVSFEELYLETVNHSYAMQDDELFIYACFVCEKYRGQGIYPHMLRAILREFREKRYGTAWIGVVSANSGSIRGIEKCGFREQRRIRYLRLGNWEKRWDGRGQRQLPDTSRHHAAGAGS